MSDQHDNHNESSPSLVWRAAGPEGESLRAAAAAAPGWYWLLRPQSEGPGAYAADDLIQLPVYIRPDGGLQSPLSDLTELSPEAFTSVKTSAGVILPTFFAGPLRPGARVGSLRVREDGPPEGFRPTAAGWWWCRTEKPLNHVDPNGVGPIYLAPDARGELLVYSAAHPEDGAGVDLFELGFAEPLLARWGIIDAAGEAGRVEAHFYGPIPTPAPRGA